MLSASVVTSVLALLYDETVICHSHASQSCVTVICHSVDYRNPNLPSSVPEIKEIPASDLSDSDDSSDNDETTLAEATSTAQTLR